MFFRKPITLFQQLLTALIGLDMLIVTVVASAFYLEQRKTLLQGIDAKLLSVATLAREIPAPGLPRPDRRAGLRLRRLVSKNRCAQQPALR
jgi:hypothetical protein